jgi:hypothetical protein
VDKKGRKKKRLCLNPFPLSPSPFPVSSGASCIPPLDGLKQIRGLMNTSLILLFVAAGVALLLLAVALVSRRRDERLLVQPNTLPRMSGSLESEQRGQIDIALGREIVQFLEEGRKIEAVKLVSEHTGWSLEKSLDALNRLDGLRKRLES